MKIATIIGTRPEIIKMSPLIPRFDKKFKHILIHTGQHFSKEMDAIFFKELKLRKPDYNLGLHLMKESKQLSKMIEIISEILEKEKPNLVVVQGDTNSTLAGAISAKKLGFKLAHVEAGCRCFDKKRPEEINRIIADHLADYLFSPGKTQTQNLLKEGIERKKIFEVGNTSIDAIQRTKKLALKSKILEKLCLKRNTYSVITLHRAETVDNKKKLVEIIMALNELSKETKLVFPVHPRTKKMLKKFKLKLSKNILKIKPLGSIDFTALLMNARIVLTDSGGIQEEAAMLNIPAVILAEMTEWDAFVRMQKNFLGGNKKNSILKISRKLIKDNKFWNSSKKKKLKKIKSPAKKIISILKKLNKWIKN